MLFGISELQAVSIDNLNTRKEKHGDEKVQALDLHVTAKGLSLSAIGFLLKTSAKSLKEAYYIKGGKLSQANIQAITVEGKFKGKHHVHLGGVSHLASIVDRISVIPRGGEAMDVRCRIAVSQYDDSFLVAAAKYEKEESAPLTLDADADLFALGDEPAENEAA